MSECSLCQNVDLEGAMNPTGTEFDRVLLRGPHAVLVPTLGMLVPGYLMAVTTRHLTSFGALGSDCLANIVGPWVTSTLSHLGQTFSEYLVFEHGAGDVGAARGGCVVHAHLHLIPGDRRLLEMVLNDGEWVETAALSDMASHATDGYAFVSQGERAWYIPRPTFPGQWIRRRVAEWAGRPHEWDWGAFPHKDNLAATFSKLAESAHSDCNFCAVAKQGHREVLVIDDQHPLVMGHQLVIPRRHVARLEELPAAEWRSVFDEVQKTMLRYREAGYGGINIGVNSGTPAGQTVEHSHIHLIPRIDGDVSDPKGGIRWMFGDKAPYWD
jgi:diadenosine tetraphosphate (Ap4A) HIT family hydrolase